MKLSRIEKRIPKTLANSKNIIQTDREYARRSSRARSTRGQENEAWALYKKIPSRESWGDLSRDRHIICPKRPSPTGKILDRRQLFCLANQNLPEQSTHTCLNLNGKIYIYIYIIRRVCGVTRRPISFTKECK